MPGFGVLVLGSSELGVSCVLCFIFRAVGFRVLLGVGVLVERGFSGLSGLSGLLGLPSFTPGAQVGSAIFFTPEA